MTNRLCGLSVFLLLAMATSEASARRPLVGQWGGEQVNLVLAANGGRLELGCAGGEITTPVTPRSNGRFTVKGRFMPHRGGAAPPEGMQQPNLDATYTGRIKGRAMTLFVRVAGEADPRRFALVRGRVTRLYYCP